MQHIEESLAGSPIEGSFSTLALDARLAEIGKAVLDEQQQEGILLRFAWENIAHAQARQGNTQVAGLMLGQQREILLAAAVAAARG